MMQLNEGSQMEDLSLVRDPHFDTIRKALWQQAQSSTE